MGEKFGVLREGATTFLFNSYFSKSYLHITLTLRRDCFWGKKEYYFLLLLQLRGSQLAKLLLLGSLHCSHYFFQRRTLDKYSAQEISLSSQSNLIRTTWFASKTPVTLIPKPRWEYKMVFIFQFHHLQFCLKKNYLPQIHL